MAMATPYPDVRIPHKHELAMHAVAHRVWPSWQGCTRGGKAGDKSTSLCKFSRWIFLCFYGAEREKFPGARKKRAVFLHCIDPHPGHASLMLLALCRCKNRIHRGGQHAAAPMPAGYCHDDRTVVTRRGTELAEWYMAQQRERARLLWRDFDPSQVPPDYRRMCAILRHSSAVLQCSRTPYLTG